MLAGRPQRDLVPLDLRDDRVRLHRVLVDGRERVLALDDVLRVGEDRFDLAAVDAVAVADVSLRRLQLAEPVEEARAERAVVDPRRVVGERLLDRADDGELLVVDDDPLERRSGGRLVLRRDGRDGLAGEADAVDGDDRPVADRVTPVGIDVLEIGGGEDADDAGHRLCRRGVDPR